MGVNGTAILWLSKILTIPYTLGVKVRCFCLANFDFAISYIVGVKGIESLKIDSPYTGVKGKFCAIIHSLYAVGVKEIIFYL